MLSHDQLLRLQAWRSSHQGFKSNSLLLFSFVKSGKFTMMPTLRFFIMLAQSLHHRVAPALKFTMPVNLGTYDRNSIDTEYFMRTKWIWDDCFELWMHHKFMCAYHEVRVVDGGAEISRSTGVCVRSTNQWDLLSTEIHLQLSVLSHPWCLYLLCILKNKHTNPLKRLSSTLHKSLLNITFTPGSSTTPSCISCSEKQGLRDVTGQQRAFLACTNMVITFLTAVSRHLKWNSLGGRCLPWFTVLGGGSRQQTGNEVHPGIHLP